MRLEGGGGLAQRGGVPLMEQPLTLGLKLRARGQSADPAQIRGRVLDSRPDDLGYFD